MEVKPDHVQPTCPRCGQADRVAPEWIGWFCGRCLRALPAAPRQALAL